jgi:uncharacterized membrane protein YidH (DUF202 family)
MNYQDLTPDEQELINRFRKLSKAEKKAKLASENAFLSWIKTAIRWLWEKITTEIIREIFRFFRYQFLQSEDDQTDEDNSSEHEDEDE